MIKHVMAKSSVKAAPGGTAGESLSPASGKIWAVAFLGTYVPLVVLYLIIADSSRARSRL
jgi:hypothetical protein